MATPAGLGPVLVVDDNESVRVCLQLVLESRGYAVLLAANGEEALGIARREPVPAALVDINMPGMDGFEVCRRLRDEARQQGAEVSVWIVTGNPTEANRRRAIAAGALEMFPKPPNFDEICAQLAGKLGKPPKPAA